jgi:hypothetical protein
MLVHWENIVAFIGPSVVDSEYFLVCFVTVTSESQSSISESEDRESLLPSGEFNKPEQWAFICNLIVEPQGQLSS